MFFLPFLLLICQINFDSHLKIVSEMTEIGETVERVDALLKETKRFQKLCDVDIERAEEVVAIGELFFIFKKTRSFIFVKMFLIMHFFFLDDFHRPTTD